MSLSVGPTWLILIVISIIIIIVNTSQSVTEQFTVFI